MMSSGKRSVDRTKPHRITYTDNFPKQASIVENGNNKNDDEVE